MSNSPAVLRHVERTEELKRKGLIPTSPAGEGRKQSVCIYRGKPTGQTRPCQGCGGKQVAVPLVACKVFGVCTVGRTVTLEGGTPVQPCNNLCPGFVAS